jgi:serine/threonine protein kinase
MDRVGKYRIRRKLGEGATSSVYLATDEAAGREVAVKVIFPEALKDREKGRVYRNLLITEASLAGRLVHPHITQIYDAVIDAELSYIVMEYVPGGTLERFCKAAQLLPLDRLVEMMFKCTRALDYANRMGVTHRDIKPANIMLAAADDIGGDIKISDFGAAIQSGDQTKTQVAGIGSPAYMSPQQLSEQPLDHRTDIWSLGVVMYQLLTARLPFLAGSNYAMVYQICNIDPPPPSTFRAETPPGLDAIVARAMQKDLGARYASWEEFSHDLAQAYRNRQLSAQQPSFSDSEKFEALRVLPFFTEFADVEIWEIVRFSRWDELAAGTVIMRDNERGDAFCFVLDGELEVSKNGQRLGVLAAGECFGEMAIIGRQDHLRSADIVSRTAARIATVSGHTLRHASDTCRMHFYQAFLEVLAGRLARANIRLAGM